MLQHEVWLSKKSKVHCAISACCEGSHSHFLVLSDGVNASDPYAPVRALRSLKHEKLQQRLFLVDKEARLRSGARGLQARKALVAFEKVVADSQAL